LLYAIDRSEYTIGLKEAIKNFEQGFEVVIPHTSFALKAVEGALEKRLEFDEQLKPHLKNWQLERLGCCTRLILYLALWELAQSGSLSSIVINEAVEMAKTFAEKDAYRFINGILDEIFKKESKQESVHHEK
jgi:transcription antitermination factor NusB